MSYQVLARKWRPRNFKELVGQLHVLQALVNALDHNRLHHAYLFTGTRGVGKTTIARILAKCLNCETGVTSEPCGQCSACQEIDEGRFVDLIEVDAASRTRLEDTKELLDNVQYAPTRGRFKVYLIDEVHMLSTHSFNALLKTLEEPPAHVKFLLATTDPHKLPITILSRCLQFSLKNMSPDKVVGHLQHVLDVEQVPYDVQALWQLGRAADGSMRDALSLTDQAIAYCGDKLTTQGVTAMLGTIDQGQVYRVLGALITGHAGGVLQAVAELAEHGPDYVAVLADMLTALHRLALAQAVPTMVDNSQGDRDHILDLASRVTSEDVQLYYQTGLIGRRDLPLSPDPRAGFEMVLLRMLAFRPDGVPTAPNKPLPDQHSGSQREQSDGATPSESSEPQEDPDPAGGSAPVSSASAASPAQPAPVIESVPVIDPVPPAPVVDVAPVIDAAPTVDVASIADSDTGSASASNPNDIPPWIALPEEPPLSAYDDQPVSSTEPVTVDVDVPPVPAAPVVPEPALKPEPTPVVVPAPAVVPVEVIPVAVPTVSVVDDGTKIDLASLNGGQWIALSNGLGIGGVTGTILANCELVSVQGSQIKLRLDRAYDTFYGEAHRPRIQSALSNYFGTDIALEIEIGTITSETPAAWRERRRQERLAEAKVSFINDVHVQAIVAAFAGTIQEHTIEPIG